MGSGFKYKTKQKLSIEELSKHVSLLTGEVEDLKELNERQQKTLIELEKLVTHKNEIIEIYKENERKHTRLIKEVEFEAEELNRSLASKDVAIEKLGTLYSNAKSSISYKVGFYLTTPIRLILNKYGLFGYKKLKESPQNLEQIFSTRKIHGRRIVDRLKSFSSESNIFEHQVVFNSWFYANFYPDLKALEGNESKLKDHWLNYGIKEGRTASPLYIPEFYTSLYSINVDKFTSEELLVRWYKDLSKGKLVSPSFDRDYYMRKYGDLKAYRPEYNLRLELHYIIYGLKEGRMASAFFDPALYLKKNSDIRKKVSNDFGLGLIQWLKYGLNEDRTSNLIFDKNIFLNEFSDSNNYIKGLKALAKWISVMDEKPKMELVNRRDDIDYTLLLDLTKSKFQRYNQFTKVSETRIDRRRGRLVTEIGLLPYNERCKNVMVVAHRTGKYIYGGERSFIDIINNIDKTAYNVICVIPQFNVAFIDVLKSMCVEIVISEYGWWKVGDERNLRELNLFKTIYRQYKIDLVHVNTIMVLEAVVAAREESIPSVIHIRELISKDIALQKVLEGTAEEITDVVLRESDYIFSNSSITQQEFPKKHKNSILYNCVGPELYALKNSYTENLKIGIISSNIRKKGIVDFVELASHVYQKNQSIQFYIIGEETKLVREIKAEIDSGQIEANIVFPGYLDSNVRAIELVNVVVNFSHFAESFGRTIAEGMAAGRPVIGYNYGAIPEWIEHGVNGYIINYKMPLEAADYILNMDAELLRSLGSEGRKMAVERFSYDVYKHKLNGVYDLILEKENQNEFKELPFDQVAYEHTLDEAKIGYFLWHFPVPSETFVLNELRHLVANGSEIKVYCKASPYPDFTPDFNIEYENVKNVAQLEKALVRDGVTIVHAHFTYPTVTKFVWPVCEKLDLPFTFIAHAQDIFRYENMKSNMVADIARSKNCIKIFTLGRYHRDFLLKCHVPWEKICINPQVINNDYFPFAKSVKNPNGSICAIGRFVPKKGFEYLIQAAEYLKPYDISIYLYGYGELEDSYKQIIAERKLDNVKLMGKLGSSKEVHEMFLQHDLLVQPSLVAKNGDMDGIPTVLVEAMSTGLPVMTTEIASVPELVQDEVNGIILRSVNPVYLADKIIEFFSKSYAEIEGYALNGLKQVHRLYNIDKSMRTLHNYWKGNKIDVVLVTYINEKYPNLPELKEVVRRLYLYTQLPFNLIIVDNGSDQEAREYMRRLDESMDNVRVIFNEENVFVGPGTNQGIEAGDSDFVFYVCAVEGFCLKHGWESDAIEVFMENEKAGMVGTKGYSPSYLYGKDLPQGVALFDKFRNKEFAENNPHREFYHVQGGVFCMRRAMLDEIGGFNTETPHSYTDVEMSYYTESENWELANSDSCLALFEKTRPGILSRITERTKITHPGYLEINDVLSNIGSSDICLCNVCEWSGDSMQPENQCPSCGSTPTLRSVYRYFAESTLSFRRLKAMYINPDQEFLNRYWLKSFQGRNLSIDSLVKEIESKGAIDNASGGFDVMLLMLTDFRLLTQNVVDELMRVLSDTGTLILWVKYDQNSYFSSADSESISKEVAKQLFDERMNFESEVLYDSEVVKYDYRVLFTYRNKIK